MICNCYATVNSRLHIFICILSDLLQKNLSWKKRCFEVCTLIIIMYYWCKGWKTNRPVEIPYKQPPHVVAMLFLSLSLHCDLNYSPFPCRCIIFIYSVIPTSDSLPLYHVTSLFSSVFNPTLQCKAISPDGVNGTGQNVTLREPTG